jgi:hypothetical protein
MLALSATHNCGSCAWPQFFRTPSGGRQRGRSKRPAASAASVLSQPAVTMAFRVPSGLCLLHWYRQTLMECRKCSPWCHKRAYQYH